MSNRPVTLGGDDYRLVVPTGPRVPADLLETAIRVAAADDARVHVAIPQLLPPTLPITATPAPLIRRIDDQRRRARETLRSVGCPERVDVLPTRSVQSMIARLCAIDPPAEIVLAGTASWSMRRAIHGLAHITVLPTRSRLRPRGAARTIRPLPGR